MAYRGEQNIHGKTYVYEAKAQWNAIKKRSEQKRVYIGTKNPDTGELIPNKKYYEIYGGQPTTNKELVNLPIAIRSVDFGCTYLMNHIAISIGLSKVLQDCFPEKWEEILVCAWHCCSENEALYLCEPWAENSYTPTAPSSQRISKLLKELDDDHRMLFYKKWAALRQEKEYLALDITSVSSWSKMIQYVEYGYNRDKENLPQINLAMLYGEQSRLPVFARVYPGSIKDASTLEGMVDFIEQLKIKQMRFVMDKGFFASDGLYRLLDKYIKFSVGVPFTTKLAKESTERCLDTIASPLNAIEVDGHIYYAETISSKMNDRRIYIHVYYNEERHTLERTVLMNKILKLEESLKNGNTKITDTTAKKYFTFHKSKNGMNIHRREDVIDEETRLSGYFVIMTNDCKDPKEILGIYRTKDVVEKSFDNLKNDLDMDRLRIHSDAAMEGRVFIGFISLIITSYIRNVMRQKNMYKSFTFNTLLLELKKQKLIEFANGKELLTELTAKQKTIYKAFSIPQPEIPLDIK